MQRASSSQTSAWAGGSYWNDYSSVRTPSSSVDGFIGQLQSIQPTSGLTRKTQTTYSNPNDMSGHSAFTQSQWSSPYETPSGLGANSEFTNSYTINSHESVTTSNAYRMLNAMPSNREQSHAPFAPSSAVATSAYAYLTNTASTNRFNSHYNEPQSVDSHPPMLKMRSGWVPEHLRPISEHPRSEAVSQESSRFHQTDWNPAYSRQDATSAPHRGIDPDSFNTGTTKYDSWKNEQIDLESRDAKRPRTQSRRPSTRASTDRNFEFIQSGGNCFGYSYEWISHRLRYPDSSAENRLNFFQSSQTKTNSTYTQSLTDHVFNKINSKRPTSPLGERARLGTIYFANKNSGLTSIASQDFIDKPSKEILESLANSLEDPGVYFAQTRYFSRNDDYLAHAVAIDSRKENDWKLFDPNRGEINVTKYNIKNTLSKGLPKDSFDRIILTKLDIDS